MQYPVYLRILLQNLGYDAQKTARLSILLVAEVQETVDQLTGFSN